MIRAQRKGTVMNKNVGTIDRALRIGAGIVLIALVFVCPQTPWGWIGVIPLVSGLVGWCPAYRLLGLRTCSAENKA
jgi:hypothetical protein